MVYAIVKGGHGQAGLVKLYHLEGNVRTLRTAQHHAKHGHPDWVAFLARNAGQAIKAKAPTVEQAQALVEHVEREQGPVEKALHLAPPAMAKPESQWSPEEYVECQAWKSLVQANQQRDIAMARGDPLHAVSFVKIASDAGKAYFVARDKREKAEIASGRLKPMSSWVAAKVAILKLAAIIMGQSEIAQAANPDKPLVALKAIEEWQQQKLGPAVRSLMDELNREIIA